MDAEPAFKPMRNIVYYVAVSLDGFISGPDEDIGGFVGGGSGVDKYLADLREYDTVLMGRKTYEFGYNFGLKPGQRAYQHMTHYIFSNNLRLDPCDPEVHIMPIDISEVKRLKEGEGSDIYLCGGGQFAGWLLDYGLIDILKVKLNPLILGDGVRLFGASKKALRPKLLDSRRFDGGLQIMTYRIARS